MKELLLAILIVESGGDPNAIGDYNKNVYTKQEVGNGVLELDWTFIKECNPAIGAYQIHWRYWKDGCETLKVDWPYSDAFSLEKSRKIVEAYFLRYGKRYTSITKLRPTNEVIARIHNGGPDGYLKNGTSVYWQRVYEIIKNLEKE